MKLKGSRLKAYPGFIATLGPQIDRFGSGIRVPGLVKTQIVEYDNEHEQNTFNFTGTAEHPDFAGLHL